VEAIIERDFFPSIPKLQSALEWAEALKSGAWMKINDILHQRDGQTMRQSVCGPAAVAAARAAALLWSLLLMLVPASRRCTPAEARLRII
jgi:hypothetical protein